MQAKLSNIEIAVYALYLLNGVSSQVHTEDVALKCYELAPDAFSWIRFPRYPDKEVARYALVDARKKRHGMLVQGRSGKGKGQPGRTRAMPAPDGWMLTSAGASWIADNAARIEAQLNIRESSDHRQDLQKKLTRLRGHEFFQNYLQKPADFRPSLGEMAAYFRCRVDADRIVWETRFESIKNIAQALNDSELAAFIDKCKSIIESAMAS